MIDHGTNSFTREFLYRVQAVVFNRKFFEDEHGNIGLAPSDAQQGDMICILNGCSVPVLLRRIAKRHIFKATGHSHRTATADPSIPSSHPSRPTHALAADSDFNSGSIDRVDFAAVDYNGGTGFQPPGSRLTVESAGQGDGGKHAKRKRSASDLGSQRRAMSVSSVSGT